MASATNVSMPCCASLTTEQLSTLSAVDSVDWKCRPCSSQPKVRRISAILPEDEEEIPIQTQQGWQVREALCKICDVSQRYKMPYNTLNLLYLAMADSVISYGLYSYGRTFKT